MTAAPAPVHIAKARQIHQSRVNEADVCAKRLEFSLRPDNPYMAGVSRAIGTAYHAGMAAHYWGIKQGEIVALEDVLQVAASSFQDELTRSETFDWTFQPETPRKREIVLDEQSAWAIIEELLTRVDKGPYWWPHDRYRVLDVEKHFQMPMADAVDPDGKIPTLAAPEGWTIAGTPDLVVQDLETGWIHVVDHKSSKTKWRKGKDQAYSSIQAAFYTDVYKRIYPEFNVTFTYDVIGIQDGTFTRLPAHRSDTQIYLARYKTIQTAMLIEQGGPYLPNPTSFLCSSTWCDYWDECPFGARLHQ